MSEEFDPEADNGAPGWEAIDEVLDELYDNAEPMHWGTILPYNLGGEDPLYGVSVYESQKQQPHLHYITYGFSDLYEKEDEESEVSGYGFELTFRLSAPKGIEPPVWVVNFLQNLARYVFQSGNGFGPGHTIPLNSPICLESETQICTVIFVEDPELGTIETPNGEVQFLQVLGLTENELDATQCWNALSFAELVQEFNPLLITDVDRDSYLEQPKFKSTVSELTAKEGASAAIMCANEFRVLRDPETSDVTLVLGAIVAPSLGKRLRGRLPFGREFQLVGEEDSILFRPADQYQLTMQDHVSEFEFTNSQIEVISKQMQSNSGTWKLEDPPGFTLVIEPTEIKDNDGNVTDVLG